EARRGAGVAGTPALLVHDEQQGVAVAVVVGLAYELPVAARVTLTLDIRNTDEDLLKKAESEVARHISEIESVYGVSITTRSLARFEPVQFDERIIDLIEGICSDIDAKTIRMPSGAGHDAQMLARVCPTAMIFVPSKDGISHNPAEHTDNEDLENGANALLRTMLALTDHEFKERR
ncbi:MAG: M20/M25/M40 family metallo-hydrolase, partial [Actinobacteria bacterium]|nr:M20/M25/M40 family metallo-hydrolase [Actinomycetota bacterium]